ncbi:MAG: glycosyl hydrolase family 18 protein [Flavobacteriales bacterium]
MGKAQQLPKPALVGYWETWTNLKLTKINPNYNVINIAFPTTKAGTDYNMQFSAPWFYSNNSFKADMQTLQSQGKKILLSIGGAADPIFLDNYKERDTFVTSLNSILDAFPFDGIDIDLETSSLSFSNVTIANPTDSGLVYIIDAIKKVLAHYQTSHNKRCLLTMAPEILYVQGAIGVNGGNGQYLPIIDALRNDIDLLMVQLYNAGNSVGVDGWSGQILQPTTSDYIIGLTEAVILGFDVKLSGLKNEHFKGLPASKVAVGLPSCANAGGKYTDTNKTRAAVSYLIGVGQKPETYTLKTVGGYPDLGGFMTWSIQKDASCTTTPAHSFARNFVSIYGGVGVNENENTFFSVYPNPATSKVNISTTVENIKSSFQIIDISGSIVYEGLISQTHESFDVSSLSAGIYFLKVDQHVQKLIIE